MGRIAPRMLAHKGRCRCNLRDARYLRGLSRCGSGLWLDWLLLSGDLGLGGGLWLSWLLLGGGLSFSRLGGGPEGKVVAEELHDKGAVAIGLLGEGVELGDGIIKSLLGEVACTVWGVQDLVVEDGEVERKAKADWVSWGELRLCNIGGVLVAC